MPCFSKLARLGYALTLLLAVAASVIQDPEPSIICSPDDPSDCYPVDFVPTKEYQVIREGQTIPAGLDIRLDWQTGVKSAKLGDGNNEHIGSHEVVLQDIEEIDDNKIVNYQEGLDEDLEIAQLKMAAEGSHTAVDLDDALSYINKGKYDDKQELVDNLDALTEHSHDLDDGIVISEEKNLTPLLSLALGDKYDKNIRELSLRAIAQSLRHNPVAVDNVNANEVLPSLLKALKNAEDSVLQKRILGVLSSLVQNEKNAYSFSEMSGKQEILEGLSKFSHDSQLRSLEILDDLNQQIVKRGDDSIFVSRLFDALQEALTKTEIQDEHSFEAVFDRVVELKKTNKGFKTDPRFLQWLADEVHRRKTSEKRGEGNEELLKKLTEARHVVFGNPMGMRKAFADEL